MLQNNDRNATFDVDTTDRNLRKGSQKKTTERAKMMTAISLSRTNGKYAQRRNLFAASGVDIERGLVSLILV